MLCDITQPTWKLWRKNSGWNGGALRLRQVAAVASTVFLLVVAIARQTSSVGDGRGAELKGTDMGRRGSAESPQSSLGGSLEVQGLAKMTAMKRLLKRSRRRLEADSENVEEVSKRAFDSERGLIRLINREKVREEGWDGKRSHAHLHLPSHTRRASNLGRGMSESTSRPSRLKTAERLVDNVDALSVLLQHQKAMMGRESKELAQARHQLKGLMEGRVTNSVAASEEGSLLPSSGAPSPEVSGMRGRVIVGGHHVDLRAPASYASDEGLGGVVQNGYVGGHALVSDALPVTKQSYLDSVFGSSSPSSPQQP